jgi:hypothetical protein
MSVTEEHYIFRAKTDNAYCVKTMAEVISNIIKTSFWKIGNNGITMSMFDQTRKSLVTVDLFSKDFFIYDFSHADNLNIGINSSHFYKMLKSIKKKDTLELFITKDNPTVLNIKTIPKDHTRITLSSINIQTVQNIEVVNPRGYTNSIIIPSSDFQKMIKDLDMIGSDKIKITVESGVISFTADADGIMKRVVTFGEKRSDNISVTSFFETEQIDRIIKISALCDQIHVFPSTDELPIQFKTRIGSIGYMSIFIKSNEILASER